MHSISVIITVYNREAYLAEAIESALAQTRPAAEIIVVDDGSTDRTGEIARSYAKVSCLTQENRGIGGARNSGLARATGDLIAFLDSDDAWTPRKLELQAAALELHPELDFVFCHMKNFLSPEIDPASRPRFDEREIVACIASGVLGRRAAFDRLGPFPTERGLPEFVPWFGRASDAGLKHLILPEVLLRRRVHPGNSVHRADIKKGYVRILKQRLDEKRAAAAKEAAGS
jgi:glycosyltransferase involved in cell wall biosynthesis